MREGGMGGERRGGEEKGEEEMGGERKEMDAPLSNS